jgi:hypothetical protein
MIATLIILAYIANVFLNRWINKIEYQRYQGPIIPAFWFTSLLCTFVFIASILIDNLNSPNRTWFTGKNW